MNVYITWYRKQFVFVLVYMNIILECLEKSKNKEKLRNAHALAFRMALQSNYIERAGTGVQRMRDGMKQVGLLEPSFEFSGFFTIILRRLNLNRDIMQEFSLNGKRAERIVSILRRLVMHQTLDIGQIATELDTTARTVRNAVDLLVTKGWVERSGTTKGRAYGLTDAGQKWVAKRV